ncbi:GMC oxidoreductase [Trametes coccinea BRFM310]|uniref:GMC oxidoreductase n=1 Tax=Trametes coccinea (strain BRFM310) TaxID=1353009 RepID=A0A1Y2J448_TRAC3|nr:GMC oxidoreductase [Trametes coccinea BRFM310]
MRYLSVIVVIALSSVRQVDCACKPRTATSAAEFVQVPFDYIVVGGGTAGTALSARLAEDSQVTVGLIEAGEIHLNDPNIDVPANSGIGNPSYDWLFSSTPQAGLGGRVISVPRGKMVGGSSGINGMAWGRASSVEYDAFSAFASSSNWSWSGLLPYMRKSETFCLVPNNSYPGISEEAAEKAQSDFQHVDGFSGPIVASHNSLVFDVVDQMVKSLNGNGVQTNVEPQAGNATGVTNTLLSINRTAGVRSYAATTYYCSHAHDLNYHVILNAQATRIHFRTSAHGLTAISVEFVVGGRTYVANARKEVILSTGSIQTPQLLELSGIGNSTILKKHGIETLIDMPQVGENLQEHTFVPVQWQLKQGVQTFDILRNNATFAAEQQALYNKTHGGLMAATDSLIAFLTLDEVVSPAEGKNLLDIFDTEAAAALSPLTKLQNMFRRQWFADSNAAVVELIQWTKGVIDPAVNESYAVILGGIVHPSSKGSVHINSSDPLAAPAIDLGLLTSEFDQQLLLQAIKFVQKLGTTQPFSNYVQTRTNPDPSAQSDEDLLAYIRGAASIGDHSIGTAPIAPQNQGGVVDHTLTVYGTSNLRVVDASVIPIHIAAHTQATVYAIAEMAADLIKQGNAESQ